MLNIKDTYTVPDTTYFRTGDISPVLSEDGTELYCTSGQGHMRSSWGSPYASTTVILNTDTLCCILCAYHHKHGGGQFYRYYTNTGRCGIPEKWVQKSWRQLSPEQRKTVLQAVAENAPRWAKIPGKA